MDFTLISSIDELLIMFYLLNVAFLLYYFFNKVNSLEEYSMKIKKLFYIKVVVLAIIITLFIFEYSKM